MKKLIFANFILLVLLVLVLWAMDFKIKVVVHFKQPNPLPDTSTLVRSKAMLDSLSNLDNSNLTR